VISLLGPRRKLLHGPAVAVRIGEEDEGAPRELLHVADLDASTGELGVGGLDVRDDHLHSLHRAGRSVADALAERNRAHARMARDEIRHIAGFSAADEIAKLYRLKSQNSISDEEYTRLRARLIL